MDINIYKIIGIAGLLLICTAMLVKSRQTRNMFAFLGGLGLLLYSIYLTDLIFTILQAFYIIVVSVDYFRQKK